MRRFGKIVVKPNKSNPKYIEASYPTPVDAFGQWPGLAARQTTTFPLTPEGRDDAAAWLSAARKESMPESGSPRGSSEGVSGRKA